MGSEEKLWVEKYRPRKLTDCIFPVELKKTFSDIIASNNFTHLLFSGSAGVGKTTAAKVLCNELDLDCMFMNASEENGIDTLRTKVVSYASSMSLSGQEKVIILDEADHLSAAYQPALRGIMEQFSKNCRFILTCNFKNKIIQPIWSRCAVVDFRIEKAEKPHIMQQIYSRLVHICHEEKITVEDKKILPQLVGKFFPDIRRMINELQRYGASGKIDTGILETLSEAAFKDLVGILKGKKFGELRKWVAVNGDGEPAMIFRSVYENLMETLDGKSIPQVILTLADYEYKSAFMVDQQLNLLACLVEIMAGAGFKE